ALSQYANREAAEYYQAALTIARAQPASASLGRLYDVLGQALERSGEYPQALANYEEMESHAQATGDQPLALLALTAQTRLRSTFTPIADPDQGQALAERALALARQLGDGAAEARLLLYLMRLAVWDGNLPQVIALGERAAASARAQALPSLLVEALGELAMWGYINTMQIRLANERLAEARALLPALAAPYQNADTLALLIILDLLRGDAAAALQDNAELQRISETLDYGWGRAQALIGAGIGLLERGELGLALPLLEEGSRLGNQFSLGNAARIICGFLARGYAALGEIEPGLAAVRRVDLVESRDPSLIVWSSAAETLLLLAGSRVAEAATAFERICRLGPPADVIAYRLTAAAEAELALAQGDTQRVIEVTTPVIDDMRREGGRAILCETLAYRSRALLAAGRLAEAVPALAEARALAETIGMRLVLWTVIAAELDLANRQNQTAAAQPLRRELHALLNTLADNAGTPARRAAFLAAPGVEAALNL
ncbi:MAG: hypothetical protein ABI847_20720, partial [Anaerolineales bacterium]